MTSNNTSDPSFYQWNSSFYDDDIAIWTETSHSYTIKYTPLPENKSFLLRFFKFLRGILDKIMKRLDH